jgi:ComF family protein
MLPDGHFLSFIKLPGSCCELCGTANTGPYCLCKDCITDLTRIIHDCSICGRALPEPGVCGACLNNPLPLDRTVAVFQYRYPLTSLIKKYKYNQCLNLARPFARALSEKLAGLDAPLPELMIPVPLHYLRLYSRGFNQALEICRILNQDLKIPFDYNLVSRARNTAPMFALSAPQRRKNMVGAYKLQRPLLYRSLAIVDDVITTGTTGSELARLLRGAGARHVELWALARAE